MGLLDGRAGHVVGDVHVAGVDALRLEPLLGQVEVHDVAGVVARREQHAAAAIGRPAHAVGVVGRRRGEDVADHGTVGEPRADDPAEGRVVAGASADHHGHLARWGLGGPNHAARHAGYGVAVHVEESRQGVLHEGRGIVVELRHGCFLLVVGASAVSGCARPCRCRRGRPAAAGPRSGSRRRWRRTPRPRSGRPRSR